MEQICYLVFPFQNETSVHRLIDVKVFNIENMEMTQRCSLPTNYEMDEGKLTKKRMQTNNSRQAEVALTSEWQSWVGFVSGTFWLQSTFPTVLILNIRVPKS